VVIFLGFVSIPIAVCFLGLGKEEMEDTRDAVEALKTKGYSKLPESLIGKDITNMDMDQLPQMSN
jgi:hypothetical protein